jgi:hypothetical protein
MNRIVDLPLRNCFDYSLPAQAMRANGGSRSDDGLIEAKRVIE